MKMRKTILMVLLTAGAGFSGPVKAWNDGTSNPFNISAAHITHVEFYESQFNIILDQDYTANQCRNFASKYIAMDSATEPGKTHMASFLTAFASDMKINIFVRDDICNGDRTTIHHFNIIGN